MTSTKAEQLSRKLETILNSSLMSVPSLGDLKVETSLIIDDLYRVAAAQGVKILLMDGFYQLRDISRSDAFNPHILAQFRRPEDALDWLRRRK